MPQAKRQSYVSKSNALSFLVNWCNSLLAGIVRLVLVFHLYFLSNAIKCFIDFFLLLLFQFFLIHLSHLGNRIPCNSEIMQLLFFLCLFKELADICRKSSHQNSLCNCCKDCHGHLLPCTALTGSKYIDSTNQNADSSQNKGNILIFITCADFSPIPTKYKTTVTINIFLQRQFSFAYLVFILLVLSLFMLKNSSNSFWRILIDFMSCAGNDVQFRMWQEFVKLL